MPYFFEIFEIRWNLRPTEESQFKSRTAQEGAASEAGFAEQSTDNVPRR